MVAIFAINVEKKNYESKVNEIACILQNKIALFFLSCEPRVPSFRTPLENSFRWYSVLSNQPISLNTEKEAKEVISIYIIIYIDIEISLQK